MRTPQREPPEVRNRSDNEFITETRRYKLITPLFGGGVEPQKADPITYQETARMARHMHAVHQLALWMLRILGLRISEAYGVLVRDVIRLGDGSGRGLLLVDSQGGRTFTEADLAAQTAGVECRKDAGVVDEIPGAYKDIDHVMANQSDLTEILHTLKQVVCVKG